MTGPSLTDSAVIKYRRNIVSGSDMMDFEIDVYAANEALVLGDCLRPSTRPTPATAPASRDSERNQGQQRGVVSSLRLRNADLRVFMRPFEGTSRTRSTRSSTTSAVRPVFAFRSTGVRESPMILSLPCAMRCFGLPGSIASPPSSPPAVRPKRRRGEPSPEENVPGSSMPHAPRSSIGLSLQ